MDVLEHRYKLNLFDAVPAMHETLVVNDEGEEKKKKRISFSVALMLFSFTDVSVLW